MKKALFLTLLSCLCVFAQAQSKKEKYEGAMKAALEEMKSTDQMSEPLLDLANRFERIGAAEKKEWLPYYYGALCYVTLAQDDKRTAEIDGFMDKANEFLKKAEAIEPENCELWVMKGLIIGMRIMVDPMNRGMQLGPEASKMYARAIRLDANNPRAKFFNAQNILFTPTAFGGGPEKALPLLRDAVASFSTFQPESDLHPNWGKEMAEQFLKQAESGAFDMDGQ